MPCIRIFDFQLHFPLWMVWDNCQWTCCLCHSGWIFWSWALNRIMNELGKLKQTCGWISLVRALIQIPCRTTEIFIIFSFFQNAKNARASKTGQKCTTLKAVVLTNLKPASRNQGMDAFLIIFPVHYLAPLSVLIPSYRFSSWCVANVILGSSKGSVAHLEHSGSLNRFLIYCL